MYREKFQNIKDGLTYDDVLLIPSRTSVEPREINLSSRISRNIELRIPIISSPMDTVTEDNMAIAMARSGGMGVVHRNLTVNQQASMIRKVKREESIIIRNVHTVSPETPLQELRNIIRTKNIGGLPVLEGDKLVGMVTKRDLEFAGKDVKIVRDIMVKKVISANQDIKIEDAIEVLYRNRIEKLPLVDSKGRVVGLITAKDIATRQKFPDASRDKEGQLLVGAAVGPFDIERAKTLEKEGANIIVVDTAHAHNENVMNSLRKMRKEISADIMAGNIATAEAAEDLISLDVDSLRVGIGPGSICTTRIIAGIGVPQITAISETAEVAEEHGIPVIGDGGIRFSGDIVKAFGAGASGVMIGSLFAGTEESPGNEIIISGRKYKAYRGMGSIGAIQTGISDRYGKVGSSKFVAEGVEGAVPYRGKVEEVLFQLTGGIRSGMGYVGSKNISSLRESSRFIRITGNGLRESHPHDIRITAEPPNYQLYNFS